MGHTNLKQMKDGHVISRERLHNSQSKNNLICSSINIFGFVSRIFIFILYLL